MLLQTEGESSCSSSPLYSPAALLHLWVLFRCGMTPQGRAEWPINFQKMAWWEVFFCPFPTCLGLGFLLHLFSFMSSYIFSASRRCLCNPATWGRALSWWKMALCWRTKAAQEWSQFSARETQNLKPAHFFPWLEEIGYSLYNLAVSAPPHLLLPSSIKTSNAAYHHYVRRGSMDPTDCNDLGG